MEMAGSGAKVLAVAEPGARQRVVRLNTPDPLAGEQTWPTNEVGQFGKFLYVVRCYQYIHSGLSQTNELVLSLGFMRKEPPKLHSFAIASSHP